MPQRNIYFCKMIDSILWSSPGLLFCKPLRPELPCQGLSNLLTCAGVRGRRAHDWEQLKVESTKDFWHFEAERLQANKVSQLRRCNCLLLCLSLALLSSIANSTARLSCLPCFPGAKPDAPPERGNALRERLHKLHSVAVRCSDKGMWYLTQDGLV